MKTHPAIRLRADSGRLTATPALVRRSLGGGGFTLVEVMLALAVVSIGIIAILGLLPIGLQSSRDAADNTLSATIVQDIFSTIRSQPFDKVNLIDLGDFTGPHSLTNTFIATTSWTLNFDYSGNSTNAVDYYRVEVAAQPQGKMALALVTATVVWPARSIRPINTNVFATYVALYSK